MCRALVLEMITARLKDEDSEIIKGEVQLVYISPEALLCDPCWREMFRSTVYKKNLVGLVIDEAHLVEKW